MIRITQGHRQCHHSIERVRLSILFCKNYAFVLYRFPVVCRKTHILPTRRIFGAAVGSDPTGASITVQKDVEFPRILSGGR